MEFTPALFSTRVTSERSTFFIDVKATKDGKPYIKITESTTTPDGDRARNYMTIFDSEIKDFKEALDSAYEFIGQQN